MTVGGFAANAVVKIALQGGDTLEATTDAHGFAVVSLIIPAKMTPGMHKLTATVGALSATTEIAVTVAPTSRPTPSVPVGPPPSEVPTTSASTLRVLPGKVVAGGQVTLTAAEFAASQWVRLELLSRPIPWAALPRLRTAASASP